MKFNSFPTELKVKIMSYLLPNELCRIVAPVSKQWHKLAYDYVTWKVLDFRPWQFRYKYDLDTHLILSKTRPVQVTFVGYNIYHAYLTNFPVCNTVRQLECRFCDFLCPRVLELLVKCFPNIEKLLLQRERYTITGGDKQSFSGLYQSIDYTQNWKRLKRLEVDYVSERFSECFLGNVVRHDKKFEEIILLNSGEIKDDVFRFVIRRQGDYLQRFTMYFHCISRECYQDLAFCHKLTHLSIYWPKQMTDDELLLILLALNDLTYFRLQTANKVFSYNFPRLFKDVKMRKLVELHIENCNKFNDEALNLLVKNSPSLKDLILRSVRKITNKGLQSLVNVGSQLEVLRLSDITSITEKCLQQLAIKLPNICVLYVTMCPQVLTLDIVYKLNYRVVMKMRAGSY